MTFALEAFSGAILGTAAGDALGLPREGLSARRAARIFGQVAGYQFLAGRGMVSDDTEHACMTAQALIVSGGNPQRFTRSLAWRLRWWLLALPAGVGFATLRPTIKLWLGFPPGRSGAYSAGNGPAMRAAVIGLFGRDVDHVAELVRVSTRMTHTHPAAEQGALAIALAARYGASVGAGGVTSQGFRESLGGRITEPALVEAMNRAEDHLARGYDVRAFASAIGLAVGVSGYINHTVPVALYAWLRWPNDFNMAVGEVIALGGDTDTVGAITGALVGATSGISAGLSDRLNGIIEWPRSVAWMTRLAARLHEVAAAGTHGRPVRLFWPGVFLRNVVFLAVVLMHGLRRLLPPY
jgi:ADP-ribosylglycohydrolase